MLHSAASFVIHKGWMRRRSSDPNVYSNDSKLNGCITQPKRFYAERDGLKFQRREEEEERRKKKELAIPQTRLGTGVRDLFNISGEQ